MELTQVNEIIECMPKERTVFRYFKDRYAFMLLSDVVGEHMKINKLKKTPYGRLLERPAVKAWLGQYGKDALNRNDVNVMWNEPSLPFVLSLGSWGGMCRSWQQTSRPGYNLVLQLNFNEHHNKAFRQLTKPSSDWVFNSYCHPAMRRGQRSYFRDTLAWSRIDLDFKNDEALIEEVQSDWAKNARWTWHYLMSSNFDGFWDMDGSLEQIRFYLENVLYPYYQLWDEAMLSATLWFIRHELGIKNIFYHSVETGRKMKNIECGEPPQSLYSDLPKRFCFSKTQEVPRFLKQEKRIHRKLKKLGDTVWYKQQL